MSKRFLPSAALFLATAVIAGLLSPKSPVVAVAMVSAGFLLSAFVLFLPAMEDVFRRAEKGKLTYKGFEWTTRFEPIRVVIPENPTNTSENAEAVQLCKRGRKILEQKESGKQVDLSAALDAFTSAAELDKTYWEPLLNTAAVLLFQGRIPEAMATASDIRLRFSNIPLAFAKATLIVAKIMELRIPDSGSEEQQASEYRKIANLLRESLNKCPDHITTRISLGRVMYYANVEKAQMEEFIREGLEREEFVSKFIAALRKEKLEDKFRSEFPSLYQELIERRGEDGTQTRT